MRIFKQSKRQRRRAQQAEALLTFQLSSVRRPAPTACVKHISDFDSPKIRRPSWAQRAKVELEAAMELDLEPDRAKRRKYVPSYERVAQHLKEKGFD